MKTYETFRLIDELQQQTESLLKKVVSGRETILPSQLLLQPGNNQWSAAQCIEHLNSYGRYYLPAIERVIEAARQKGSMASSGFKPGRLGNYFTKLMMPAVGDKKIKKMSAPKGHRPTANLDAEKVVSEFIEQQEKLLSLLEKARTINIEKEKIPISIARFIKLKLGDTFRFLIAHNQRHVLQAERAIAQTMKQAAKQDLVTSKV